MRHNIIDNLSNFTAEMTSDSSSSAASERNLLSEIMDLIEQRRTKTFIPEHDRNSNQEVSDPEHEGIAEQQTSTAYNVYVYVVGTDKSGKGDFNEMRKIHQLESKYEYPWLAVTYDYKKGEKDAKKAEKRWSWKNQESDQVKSKKKSIGTDFNIVFENIEDMANKGYVVKQLHFLSHFGNDRIYYTPHSPGREGFTIDDVKKALNDQSKFTSAFANDSLVKIHGCQVDKKVQRAVKDFCSNKNRKDKLEFVRKRIEKSFPFQLAKLIKTPVWAAPMGSYAIYNCTYLSRREMGKRFCIESDKSADHSFQRTLRFFETNYDQIFKRASKEKIFDATYHMKYKSKLLSAASLSPTQCATDVPARSTETEEHIGQYVDSLGPDKLYREIVSGLNGPLTEMIDENFTILARPGEVPQRAPQAGDVLLRVALGEPGLGHVAVISDSTLWPSDQLTNAPFKCEEQLPGFYASVIEGGAFPHTQSDHFARRILDSESKMPFDQLLLRPEMPLDDENSEKVLVAESDSGFIDEYTDISYFSTDPFVDDDSALHTIDATTQINGDIDQPMEISQSMEQPSDPNDLEGLGLDDLRPTDLRLWTNENIENAVKGLEHYLLEKYERDLRSAGRMQKNRRTMAVGRALERQVKNRIKRFKIDITRVLNFLNQGPPANHWYSFQSMVRKDAGPAAMEEVTKLKLQPAKLYTFLWFDLVQSFWDGSEDSLLTAWRKLPSYLQFLWSPENIGNLRTTYKRIGGIFSSEYIQSEEDIQEALPTGQSAWQYLISFRPPVWIQKHIKSRGRLWDLHRIESAHGQVNLDDYQIEVMRLPILGGGRASPEALLDYMRRNINNFIDISIAEFQPYSSIDRKLWLSANPLAAVIHIDMKQSGVNIEDGSVLVSQHAPDNWIFSTVYTPGDFAHPLSGNRQFGFIKEGNTIIFFTRAADRITRRMDTALSSTAFGAAHQLWQSLQRRLTNFINQSGGSASIGSAHSQRYNWPRIRKSYHQPTTPWI